MSSLPGTPLRYKALSVSDTIDATDEFPGAMSLLSNLIPMPQTKDYWICRPGATERATNANFVAAGFPIPGFISASIVIGDRWFGMISGGNFPGQDEPFCYDLAASAFVAIAGATALNCPTSPATTGAWVPPTMDIIGVNIIITHPGFDGTGAKFFGVINISNPGALTYTCQNTVTNALPAAPTAVKNFNGRAWYLVNPTTGQPGAYYSDVLVAGTITNASQVLTFDDNKKLTALGALPLSNQLGGVIQALIVFKGVTNMYQVTGDAATSNLAKNALNLATGTKAPLSITPTPKGLMFLSPDGFRIVDFAAQVSDPIGSEGLGVSIPFIYANVPSRVVAAASADVMRATTQNTQKSGSPWEEYWFHFSQKCWSGPHSLPASQIQRWDNTFVVAPQAHTGSLAISNTRPGSTDSFLEYAAQLTWGYATAFLPDTSQMSMIGMIETTVNIAYVAAAGNVIGEAINGDDAVIASVTFSAIGGATVWGAFVWGASPWLGALVALRKRQLRWTIPIVSSRLKLLIQGDSASGVILGDLFMRYEILNYLTDEFT